ncbi:MAG TPA: hypothetical protein DIC60_03730 [Lachnospiraceae bacterium]|nr:hypothetical protein [Lachnospiraceae bacterium]
MVGIWADLYSPERYRKYSDAQKKFIDLIMNIPRDKDRDLDFYTVVYLYRHLSIALYGMEVGIDNRQNVLSEEWKKSNAGLIYKKYMSYSFYINADDIEAKVSKIKEWKRHMQDRYSSLNIKPVRLAEKDMDGLVDIFI